MIPKLKIFAPKKIKDMTVAELTKSVKGDHRLTALLYLVFFIMALNLLVITLDYFVIEFYLALMIFSGISLVVGLQFYFYKSTILFLREHLEE